MPKTKEEQAAYLVLLDEASDANDGYDLRDWADWLETMLTLGRERRLTLVEWAKQAIRDKDSDARANNDADPKEYPDRLGQPFVDDAEFGEAFRTIRALL